jgi:hypothetical protein
MRMKNLLLLPAALLGLAGACLAQVPAITAFTGASTFNSIGGTDQTLGFTFTANSNLVVTALGIWESNPAMPLGQTHQVGLWTASGTLLASGTVPTNGPATGNWRYVAIAPVVLTAAQTYFVGSALTSPYSDFYSRVPAAGGSVTASPLITIVASATSASASGFAFPGTADAAYLGRFGPNLIVAAVPASSIPIAPWTLGIVGAGLASVALLVMGRRYPVSGVAG